MSRESERVITIYDSEGELRESLDALAKLTGVPRSTLIKRMVADALSSLPVTKSARPTATARKKLPAA